MPPNVTTDRVSTAISQSPIHVACLNEYDNESRQMKVHRQNDPLPKGEAEIYRANQSGTVPAQRDQWSWHEGCYSNNNGRHLDIFC